MRAAAHATIIPLEPTERPRRPSHRPDATMPTPMAALPGSRRTFLLLVLLVFVVQLGWEAGTFLALRRSTERLLAPPTPAELSRADAGEAAVETAHRELAAAAVDPPVAPGRMALWFALPLAGTTLLVLATGRRR